MRAYLLGKVYSCKFSAKTLGLPIERNVCQRDNSLAGLPLRRVILQFTMFKQPLELLLYMLSIFVDCSLLDLSVF